MSQSIHIRLLCSLVLVFGMTPVAVGEVIGPYDIQAAPISATLITGGNDKFWLDIKDVAIDYNTAFSGFSIIADGFANLGSLHGNATIIEVEFAPGAVVNLAGSDLVFFDARFSDNSYAITTAFDGFVAELALPSASFIDTGEDRYYYYGGNPDGPFLANIMAAEIDLSDLGVPANMSVTRIRFITTSDEADPLGIGSLTPEPSTALLLGLGILLLQRRLQRLGAPRTAYSAARGVIFSAGRRRPFRRAASSCFPIRHYRHARDCVA